MRRVALQQTRSAPASGQSSAHGPAAGSFALNRARESTAPAGRKRSGATTAFNAIPIPCQDASASLPEAFAHVWETARGTDQAAVRAGLVEVDEWRPWWPQAWALLRDDERERVQRLRRPDDRDARVLAYALHRLALAIELRMPAADVPLYRDELGCPRLRGHAVHTSLSHCEGAVAWAIGRHGALGIDLEPASRSAWMDDIAARVCHPVEARDLAALPGHQRGAALLALWVRKEAVLKAAGIGMAVEMECFRSDTQWVDARPALPACLHVRQLDTGPRWVAALAATDIWPLTAAWLRP